MRREEGPFVKGFSHSLSCSLHFRRKRRSLFVYHRSSKLPTFVPLESYPLMTMMLPISCQSLSQFSSLEFVIFLFQLLESQSYNNRQGQELGLDQGDMMGLGTSGQLGGILGSPAARPSVLYKRNADFGTGAESSFQQQQHQNSNPKSIV